jgi:ADP-ribose pyrophosphatase
VVVKPWDCLSKQEILDRSPWLSLQEHHIRLPNGEEIPDWLWVKTPDFINVVAVTAEGNYLCFRQQKYAVEGITLAIVGGYLDPDEDPHEAAERELQEETGYVSDQWTSLGGYAIDGNRGCGKGHLFLAENCVFKGQVTSDDLEDQEMIRLSRDEMMGALQQQAFGVMSWVAAVALALLRS